MNIIENIHRKQIINGNNIIEVGIKIYKTVNIIDIDTISTKITDKSDLIQVISTYFMKLNCLLHKSKVLQHQIDVSTEI